MSSRQLLAVGALAFAAVCWLAANTSVPSEDGVSYLWMAQRFAAGDWRRALAAVFPPGFPLLLAPWVAVGAPVERVATVVNAAALALTLVPLVRLARFVHAEAAWPAAVLWASSPLLLRVAAECYSEPVYLLLLAWGTWLGARERWWAMGALAGLAFWIRPEGLALAASFVLVQPRSAWRALLPAAALVLLLAAWRASLGLPFDALPLLAFHEQRDDLPDRGAFFANLLAVPGPWLEAFGVAGILVWFVPWRQPRAAMAMRSQIAMQVAAICTFVVRRRFFLSCAVPVVAFAGAALARWPARWRHAVLTAAALLGAVFAWLGRIEPDREQERALGAWLSPQLHSGDLVLADLPRVAYFAGVEPGPPRHFSAEALLQRIADEQPRVLVLGTHDAERLQRVRAGLPPTYAAAEPPAAIAASTGRRGVAVFVRR